MKAQRQLSIHELVQRRSELIGRTLEHISGNCSPMRGEIDRSCDIWKGTISDLTVRSYSSTVLMSFKMSPASRLVALRRGGHTTEDCESCEFGIDPSEFFAFEWSDGEISLHSGEEYLDDMFVIRAPKKLLLTA